MGCIACWVISWDVFHVGSLVVDVFHFGSLVVDVFHFGSLVGLYSMLDHLLWEYSIGLAVGIMLGY